jgi:hypothetical protein
LWGRGAGQLSVFLDWATPLRVKERKQENLAIKKEDLEKVSEEQLQ